MASSQHDTHILYLSRKDLEEINLSLPDMLEIVEKSFVEKGKGGAIMEPKHWYDWGNNRFFSAMTAYTPAFGVAGVKWQSGAPDLALRVPRRRRCRAERQRCRRPSLLVPHTRPRRCVHP